MLKPCAIIRSAHREYVAVSGLTRMPARRTTAAYTSAIRPASTATVRAGGRPPRFAQHLLPVGNVIQAGDERDGVERRVGEGQRGGVLDDDGAAAPVEDIDAGA